MLRRIGIIVGLAVLTNFTLLADFSYEETSTITGGMVASMMKFASAFSKKAAEPIHSTISFKGNKMMRRSADSATLIDLDARTITTINFRRQTYSVMTFDQMKQMMDQMSQKMKENNTQAQFKVTANATGATRQISGFDTKEMMVKMEMQGTDQQSGQTGSMVITNDMWLAPSVPGYSEVRDFYKRMGQELNWTPGGGMFAMNPQVSQGMAEVYKEMAKVDGIPVLQNITMSGAGSPAGTTAANQSQSPQQNQPDQQSQDQQQQRPSVGGAMGSALAGHFGFGRKKHQDQDQDQQQQQTPSGNASGSGTLLEMNTETSNFSAGPVDDSQFAVPTGFKQVEPNSRRMPRQ